MKTNIKNILIPIDFSETSLNALNTSIQMAKRHGAALHLLYVQDITNYNPELGQLVTIDPMVDEAFEKEKYLLEQTASSISLEHLVICHLHFAKGILHTVIAQYATELSADILVIGTDPGISKKSYLEDSLVYKVLKKTTCHVLTVPARKEINHFRQIIFPVLSDEKPLAKLQLARSIIEKNNAAVYVVGIVKKHELNILKPLRELSDRIRMRLNRFAGKATKGSIYSVSPAKDINAISRKENAQLIVIEGRTKRTLKEFFFGNFTQRMIRNTRAAVLMVKPDVNTNHKGSAQNAPVRSLQLQY
ncbi:universal stress protein [Mucilaginibacter litoreus]|uniref:Universal stress protein n=1 Tax=Mucilaginibacter litoreus TaxID=1048221 RepID=A0ABW3ASZ3_9SPHI